MQIAYGSWTALVQTLQRRRVELYVVLIGCVAFVGMDRWPLYSENQNTKFFYGLAKAGVGRLKDDWLLEQGSGLPIFDAFVYLSTVFLGEWFFHVCHLGIVIAFTAAVYGIARVVGLTNPSRFGPGARWFLPIFGIWFVLFNTSHSTLRVFKGLANQHINGSILQPQSFGVLALLGLLLFRIGETGWAVVLIVAAAWIHPPYAVSGLMILLGMMIARLRFRTSVHAPWLVLAAGVVGCLAAAGFAYSLLQPSDPAAQAEALRIITEIRIPKHSWPEIWFDEDATYRLAALCVVLWLARRDPLGWVLATVTASIVVLTLWVHFTRDTALALAAPWRASAIMIPAGVAILFGRVTQGVADWAHAHAWRRRTAIGAGLLVLAVGIINATQKRIEVARRAQAEPTYFAWVRENARDGDLFLTSIGETDFRLATGEPQYVTWKTHPHRAEAVLKWYERIERAQAVTEAEQPSCDLLATLADEGVTHLVRQTPHAKLDCPDWHNVYSDPAVTIFSLRR